EAIENAARIGGNVLVVAREKEDVLFNLSFSVESTGKSYPEITPHTFAFNTIEGMCLDCQGLGCQYGANLLQNPDITAYSTIGLMRYLWGHSFSNAAFAFMEKALESKEIDPYTPLRQ